jgi:hypothetical protein
MAILYSPLQFDSIPDSVNEGATETISVFSINISETDTFYWKIVSANSPAVTGTNFTSRFNTVQGSFVVNVTDNEGEGSFTITTKADNKTSPTANFLFNILIYSNSSRTTLVATTAPKPITLKDTSRGKSASFKTIPTTVTEDNSYTVEIDTTGYSDGTELLAAIYVNTKIEFRPGGSSYTVVPLPAQTGTGVDPRDFGFDDLNSTWTAVPPLPGSSASIKLFYATSVFIYGDRGSFVFNVSKDDVKEVASIEYFTINILDPTTRTTTKEWTALVSSSKISIVDSTTDTIPGWSGVLSWNLGAIPGSTVDKGFSFQYNFNPAGQPWTFTSVIVRVTGATLTTSPQRLYWNIFFERPAVDGPVVTFYRTLDGMFHQEFKNGIYGSFNMVNSTSGSGSLGTFTIALNGLPAGIIAWPARYFQIRILESLPSGRTLLTTVGRNSSNDYYLRSLVNNNLNNNPSDLGSNTLSNAYWVRVDLATAKQYKDDVTLWNSTTAYGKNVIVRIASGFVFRSYGKVEASIRRNNTAIGGSGLYTDVYNPSSPFIAPELDFYNTLLNTYNYPAPDVRTLIYSTKIVGPYTFDPNTGEYTFDEGTSIDIVYGNFNISATTLMKTLVSSYPAGSPIPFSDYMSYNSVAEVNAYSQYLLSIKTLKNFKAQIGAQGFQVPRFPPVIVKDTSTPPGGSAPVATNNQYSIVRLPGVAYTNKIWISRITVDSQVPSGQTVDIYIYYAVSGVANPLISTTSIKVNGNSVGYDMNVAVPGTSFRGFKFSVAVDAGYYFSIECVFKTSYPLSRAFGSGSTYYQFSVDRLLYGLSVYEGTLVKAFGTFVLTAVDLSGYNSDYELTTPNYGIEIFKPDNSRTAIYNTNAVTWNQVDIFTVAADSSATKTYNIISGKEVQVQQILLNAPPVDREARAHTVTRTGTQVSVSGGNQTAQFLVLMR